jgi:hypothetical protein
MPFDFYMQSTQWLSHGRSVLVGACTIASQMQDRVRISLFVSRIGPACTRPVPASFTTHRIGLSELISAQSMPCFVSGHLAFWG